MKVKNIAFSGFMAAILMGATGANAALNVASTDYVDAKTNAVATSVSNVDQDLQTFKTTVSTTYETIENVASVAEELAADAEQIAKDAKSYTETKIAELSEQLMGGGEGSEDQGLTGKVTANTLAIDGLKTRATDLETRATDLETLVGTESVASQIAAAVLVETNARTSADETMQGEIDAVEGRATALEGLVGETSVASQISGAISASEATTKAAYEKYVSDSISNTESNIGELSSLSTDAKASAVAAINEVDAHADAAQAAANAAQGAADAAQATADAAVVANEAITAGTHTVITYDEKGLVTGGRNLTKEDIPTIEQNQVNGLTDALTSKITMPEVCEKTTCVLTVDSANGTVAWAPLFTADDAKQGS